MKLERKLKAWQDADLIDADTASRIASFETGSNRPIALWAAGGIGALAIALGLVSVVAANWAEISDYTKLGFMFATGVVLAASIYRVLDSGSGEAPANVERANQQWLRETLVIVFYGYALASLALVGQIYQLGGTVGGLLTYWTFGTAGVVFLGRGRTLGVLFFIGLLATYCFVLLEWIDGMKTAESTFETNVAATLIGVTPLLFMGLAPVLEAIAARVQRDSHFAEVFKAGSWMLVFVIGFTSQFFWYGELDPKDVNEIWAQWSCLFIAAVFAAAIPKLYPDQSPRAHSGARATLLLAFGIGVLGIAFPHAPLALVGALLNLIFLCVCAWTALQAGSKTGFNFLTAAIGLRVVVVYFEVFGSLLQTGLGLIVGGALTLFVTWLWVRKSGALAGQLAGEAKT